MKYSNAYNVLPVDIVRIIQEYVNGEYLYIPRKEEEQKKWCDCQEKSEPVARKKVSH